MRAVVVFESVLCTAAGQAPRDAGEAALVVVGAPTHMWGVPSEP